MIKVIIAIGLANKTWIEKEVTIPYSDEYFDNDGSWIESVSPSLTLPLRLVQLGSSLSQIILPTSQSPHTLQLHP